MMSIPVTIPSPATSTQTGTKRRQVAETKALPDNPNSAAHNTLSSPSDANCLQATKRFKQSENSVNEPQQLPYAHPTHWLAFDLITAVRPGLDPGCDQAPIVQLSAVLGTMSENRVIDRVQIDIEPNELARTSESNVAMSEVFPQPDITVPKDEDGDSLVSDGQQENEKTTCPLLVGQTASKKTVPPVSINVKRLVDWNDGPQIRNGSHSLREAMNTLTKWLSNHDVLLDDEPKDCRCIVITDGHVPLRNVLYPQTAYLEVDRSVIHRNPWCSYVNVLDWCANDMTAPWVDDPEKSRTPCSVTEAYIHLGLSTVNQHGELPSKVEQLASLIQALISKGVPMCESQLIRTSYQHKVFPRSIQLDDSCVVEVRQVPWSATPAIVAGFFTGLNVIPGGVAIRMTEGRRSNTAIVAFESASNAQLALARHHHQLCGNICLESNQETTLMTERSRKESQPQPTTKAVTLQVYTASALEFIQCAGCDQPDVAAFLDQLTHGEQVVVRVRGLPYTATKQQILDFFDAVQAKVFLKERGVYLVTYPEGRPTGDAFVLFNDNQTATRALKRHKDYLGDRYVELFKASPSEMVQVCFNVSQQPQGPSTASKNGAPSADTQSRCRSSLNATAANWTGWTPYVFQSPFGISQQPQASTMLGKNPISHIEFAPSLTQANLNLTDSFSVGNLLCMNLPPAFPSQAATSSFGCLTSLSVNALRNRYMLEPVTQDLKDPTDPDCPYARQLPPGGVSGLIQLSGLPRETSRHDIRLYLGPVNMSKVYRMRQMVPKINQSTSTWLISVIHTTEGLQLIRDLLHRPFSLTTPLFTGTEMVSSNVPTFSLYHVGADKTPVPIPLHDPSMGIPWDRIYGMYPDPQSPELWITPPVSNPHSNTFDIASSLILQPSEKAQRTPSNCNNQMTNQSTQNQLLQALLAQTQLSSTPYQLEMPQPSFNLVNIGHSSLSAPTLLGYDAPAPVLYKLQQAQMNTNLAFPNLFNASRINAVLPNGTPSNASNIVMLSGVSMDVTSDELTTLFRPISQLLSSPPQVTLYEALPNGTATFLAICSSPLEAQAVALYCSNGVIRNRPFTACLLPLPLGTATKTNHLPESLTKECNDLSAITNLMLFPPALSSPNLSQSQSFTMP